MNENIGNLNYQIKIGADFTPFDELERRVDALQAKTAKVTKAASTAKASRGGKTLEQKREDQVKKRAQAESVREVQRLKKLEAQRVAIIRAAASDRIRIAKAEAKQRARIEAEKQRITGSDARRSAQTLTRNESASRKKELANLKASILERDKEVKLAQKAAAYNDVNLQATNRINASKRELAIKQAQINKLVSDQGISQRAAAERVGVTASQAKQLGLNMWDAEHAARQFLFTFRRLVGILAIFTLARKFAQAMGAAVQEMARFNAEIETAEISIATIVSSVGQVRDQTGSLVKGAEGFAIALDASRGIINELKKDAIGSIATFEALTKAYQVAIGPGLAAGLDLRQIKEVSNGLAEAAIRMGIPINQLSEEIRSLLQGTATARNTRIAVLFGGAKEANEAIRNAKEQGNLYQLLTESLAGVKEGAKASAQSFAVLQANLQDTFQLLLKEGGIEYFLALKESMQGLAQAVTEVDSSGTIIGFSPEALGVVQELSATLAEIIRSFRELTDTGQVLLFIRNALATVGDVLKTIAPLVSGLFQGLITGANLALAPLRLIIDVIRRIAGSPLQKLNKGFSQVIKYLTAGVVALGIWNKIIKSNIWLKVFDKIAFNLRLIAFQFYRVVVAQALAQAELLGIVVGTAQWNILLTGIVLKMALITGGLFVLLGVVGFILVKTGALEKLFGLFNGSVKEGSKQAEGLYEQIAGAASATDEGAMSAKDWVDEFKKLNAELVKAEGLKGLTGQAEEYAGLLFDSLTTLKEQTEQLRSQEDALKGRKKALEEELKLVKERRDILAGPAGDATSRRVDVYNPLGIAGQATITTDPRQNALDQEEQATSALNNINGQLLDNKKAQAEQEQLIARQLELQVRILNAKYPRELAYVDAVKSEQEATQRLTELLFENANVSVRELANLKAKNAFTKADIAQARQARALAIQSAQLAVDQAKTLETATALKREETRLNQESVLLSKEEDALLANQTRELEKQKAILAGDFTAGISKGLEDFTRELPALGVQMADIVSGALTDLAGVVASTFKDAIDPRTDADLRTAFGEFFLDLAGQFVEAITSQLIASAVTKLGFGAAPLPDPALLANTTSTDLNTAELAKLNIRLASGPLPSSAPAGATPAIPAAPSAAPAVADTVQKGAGSFFAGLLTNPLLWAIFIPILVALLTKGFKKGGQVKGYASGGDVASIPRPSSIPASDTVPAWLTPGEFVIKRDSVKKYGAGLLTAINNGVLNPKSFSATGFALGGMARGMQHFATGGMARPVAPSGRGSSQPQQIVLPILPATNGNMEQIISGGRTAFRSNVNKVDYIGDPNKSGSWS